jgi:hypothetical protein
MKRARGPRVSRRYAIALVAIGVAIGTTMMATPAASHVGGTVSHVAAHMKDYFFTKSQSNARFIRGKGKVYHARLTFPTAGGPSGPIVTVPGFGDVEGQCGMGAGPELYFINYSGGDLDAWWSNKDGVGFQELSNNEPVQVTPSVATPYMVVLQVSRAGRTATITATQNLVASECWFSAQAVAQID